jgi:hypothetical protein
VKIGPPFGLVGAVWKIRCGGPVFIDTACLAVSDSVEILSVIYVPIGDVSSLHRPWYTFVLRMAALCSTDQQQSATLRDNGRKENPVGPFIMQLMAPWTHTTELMSIPMPNVM